MTPNDFLANMDKRIALGDVVFGENAVNLEEGKFKKSDSGEIVFIPDYDIVSVRAGDMQAFADDGVQKHFHYGDFISGSAVRGDAQMIFTNIRQQVKSDSRNLFQVVVNLTGSSDETKFHSS